MNPIDTLFQRLRSSGRKAFIPFLTAGDPDLDFTQRVLTRVAREGADLIEVGFPFSDPIADGPVIQASYTRALDRGLKIDDIFKTLAAVTTAPGWTTPVVGMVSYSLVHRQGPASFVDRALASGMNGAIVPGTVIPYNFVAMGEPVNNPASVFSYFSPMYRLPFNPALFGPEFQIFTPTESVVEANMMYQILHQPNSDPSIDLSPFVAVAGNTSQLLDMVDKKFFYGRMPAQIRTAMATAIDASYDNNQRVETAVYLAALTGQYQVQY